jgi:replication-associated recombination protein RarA
MKNPLTLTLALRPRTLADFIGLKDEIAVLKKEISLAIPRVFLFKGPFGCGKTSLAWALARELQGPDFPADVDVLIEKNNANITGIDAMRDLLETYARSFPAYGPYNILFLDEAHRLSRPSQELLLKEFEVENTQTIYMLGSTDPQKLIEGIRAGRCFTITVRGLDALERRELVDRAVAYTKYKGDIMPFMDALIKARVTSPRKILMAFEAFHAGASPVKAVEDMQMAVLPEYYEIAMGVVFGSWSSPYTLFNKQYKSVAEQIKALDDSLRGTGEGDVVEEDRDTTARPEVARAVRSIVAATLKGQVLKGNRYAAEAMFTLAHCVSPAIEDSSMDFALTVGGLFRVNQKMKESK